MKNLSLSQQAQLFGATIEQCRALHLRNAADCDKAADKAEAKGGKIGGYDAQWWRESARMRRAKAAEEA